MVKTDKQHDCILTARDLFRNLVLASDTMSRGQAEDKEPMDLGVRQVLSLCGFRTLGKSRSCFLMAYFYLKRKRNNQENNNHPHVHNSKSTTVNRLQIVFSFVNQLV